MLQVCCSMQLQWFFLVFQIIIALFYLKMLQIMILDPFLTIFNEKSNMQPFWPVCSNYAAKCSNRDFFLMSTPSSLIRHAKLVLIPNFGAWFKQGRIHGVISRVLLGRGSNITDSLQSFCADSARFRTSWTNGPTD